MSQRRAGNWPNEGAMGKRAKLEGGSAPVWRQVIGIVGDVRQDSLAEAGRPEACAPLLQVPVPYLVLALRTRAEPAAFGYRLFGKNENVLDFHCAKEI